MFYQNTLYQVTTPIFLLLGVMAAHRSLPLWRMSLPWRKAGTWSQWLTDERVQKSSPFATRRVQLCGAICAPELPLGSCRNWCLTEISFCIVFLSPYFDPFTPPLLCCCKYHCLKLCLQKTLTWDRALRNQICPNILVIQCMINLELSFHLSFKGEVRDIYLYNYRCSGGLWKFIFMPPA